jgi:hypothetical protein
MSLDFELFYEIDGNNIEVFRHNITHNLGTMADKAHIYECLWRPKEYGFERADDITLILEKGLNDLKSDPEYFKQFNAPNGWGLYEHFVEFVEEVLEACKKYPSAKIQAWR